MNIMPIYTRSDLDGLLGCAILKEAGYGGEIEFMNPLDALSNPVMNPERCIRVNLPGTETLRWDRHIWGDEPIVDKHATASSEILSSIDNPDLRSRFAGWMTDLERWQTHRLEMSDFNAPTPILTVASLCDPATGLGRYRDFIVSNYFFLLDLIDQLRCQPAEALIHLGDVQDRLDLLASRKGAHEEQIRRTIKGESALLIQDLRDEYRIEPGNPMMKHIIAQPHLAILSLFWDKNHKRVSASLSGALGKEPPVHLGSLLQTFDGGGDRYSGITQVTPERVEELILSVRNGIEEQVGNRD